MYCLNDFQSCFCSSSVILLTISTLCVLSILRSRGVTEFVIDFKQIWTSIMTQLLCEKKPRLIRNGRDSISSLGDDVLSNILSRLPKKESIRTCILSKQWRWRWMNMISNDCYTGLIRNEKGFLSFSERMLNVSSIKELNIWFCDTWYDTIRVQAFISTFFRREMRIENLEVTYGGRHVVSQSHNLPNGTCLIHLDLESTCSYIVLPFNLFSDSLKRLSIQLPLICKVPGNVFFPNLTGLCLANVEICNEISDTDVLTFSLPLVKEFTLRYCRWVNVKSLNVDAPNLNTFSYGEMLRGKENDDLSMNILGKNLKRFFTDDKLPMKLIMTGSNIVDATPLSFADMGSLQFLVKKGLQAERLLEGFSSLQELELSSSWAMAIIQSGFRLPKLGSLRRLSIHYSGDIEALIKLLHVTPCLKILHIDMMRENWVDYDYDAMECVPSCISLHLEEFKFEYRLGAAVELGSTLVLGVFNYMAVSDVHFELPKFFMKNGLKLEMVVFSRVYPKIVEAGCLVSKVHKVRYSRSTGNSGFRMDTIWVKIEAFSSEYISGAAVGHEHSRHRTSEDVPSSILNSRPRSLSEPSDNRGTRLASINGCIATTQRIHPGFDSKPTPFTRTLISKDNQ